MAADAKLIIGIDSAGPAGSKTGIAAISKLSTTLKDAQKKIEGAFGAFAGLPVLTNKYMPSDIAILASSPFLMPNIVDQFRDQFQARSRLDRIAPGSVNFEQAYWRALKETGDYLTQDAWPCVLNVDKPMDDYPPSVLDAWMWGPLGEFVSLPRLGPVDDRLTRLDMDWDGRRYFETEIDLGRWSVEVAVTILHDPYSRYAAMNHRGGSPYARPKPVMFVRFANYEGVLSWRRWAEETAHAEPREVAIRDYVYGDMKLEKTLRTKFAPLDSLDAI